MAKTATVREVVNKKGERIVESDLSDRPAGWPVARSFLPVERVVAFLRRHGYVVTVAEGK